MGCFDLGSSDISTTNSHSGKFIFGMVRKEDAMKIARISCDKMLYSLPEGKHENSNLYKFFGVSSDKCLWISGSDGNDDVLISNDKRETVVKSGTEFYTILTSQSPKLLPEKDNPGASLLAELTRLREVEKAADMIRDEFRNVLNSPDCSHVHTQDCTKQNCEFFRVTKMLAAYEAAKGEL